MKLIMKDVPAQKPSSRSRTAATVKDLLRLPPTTIGLYDHVAAAAYLMRHAGTTALIVNAQSDQPAGIITEADVARAVADGKDLNDLRVYAAMLARPAVPATAGIRDTAKLMTARHVRHLPVVGESGLLGVVDIIDVCRALINMNER